MVYNANVKKLLAFAANAGLTVGEFAQNKGQIQKQLDLLRLLDPVEWKAL